MKFDKDAWDKYIEEKNPFIVSAIKSFAHSLDHYAKRDNEDDRRFCIVEIDQAIELFLKGILLKEGKNPYHTHFPRLLDDSMNILGISQKERGLISRLHEERDACQHEGRIPDVNHTEYLVHSAFRLRLDKAQKALGITPDVMADKIPGLLFMDMKEAVTKKLPEEPEILKYLEGASKALLVYGALDSALAQVAGLAASAIDIIYRDEEGPSLDKFDPRELIEQEMSMIAPSIRAQFARLKIETSKVPFDMTFSAELVPAQARPIRKLRYLVKEGVLNSDTSGRILKILHIALLHSTRPQLRRREEKEVGRLLSKCVTFDFLINEFLFLRHFCLQSDTIRNVISEYLKEKKQTLFGELK